MDDETAAKVAKLPSWARRLIEALQVLAVPQTEEICRLRRRVAELERANEKNKNRVDAMAEMFLCAAKEGNELALAVKMIVQGFLAEDAV